MQHQLNMLFEPKINGPEITSLMAKLLDVNISDGTIKQELEDHPDYPSLLSISDLLTNYGIRNVSIRFNPKKFVNAPYLLLRR